MSLCKTVMLYSEDGRSIETLISKDISDSDIERMAFECKYNFGDDIKEDMQLCVRVEIK